MGSKCASGPPRSRLSGQASHRGPEEGVLLGDGSTQASRAALRHPVLTDLLPLSPVAASAVQHVVGERPPAVDQDSRRCVFQVIAADEKTLLAVRALEHEWPFSAWVRHALRGITSNSNAIGWASAGNGSLVVPRPGPFAGLERSRFELK
jgi:hypothetical protein